MVMTNMQAWLVVNEDWNKFKRVAVSSLKASTQPRIICIRTLWIKRLLASLMKVFSFSVATGQSSPDSTSAEDVSLPCWIVRMVMTSCINSAIIKQKSHNLGVAEHVLPGHVVMSRELSQLLNTRDLSLVKIQNISHDPSDVQGIILHPFGDTEQKVIFRSQEDLITQNCQGKFTLHWLYMVDEIRENKLCYSGWAWVVYGDIAEKRKRHTSIYISSSCLIFMVIRLSLENFICY